jgi:hypothetical protein
MAAAPSIVAYTRGRCSELGCPCRRGRFSTGSFNCLFTPCGHDDALHDDADAGSSATPRLAQGMGASPGLADASAPVRPPAVGARTQAPTPQALFTHNVLGQTNGALRRPPGLASSTAGLPSFEDLIPVGHENTLHIAHHSVAQPRHTTGRFTTRQRHHAARRSTCSMAEAEVRSVRSPAPREVAHR